MNVVSRTEATLSTKDLSPPVRPDLGGIRIGPRAKVSQNDKILDLTGIFENDTGCRRRLRTENFVFSQFGESNQLWAIECEIVDPSAALDNGQSVGAIITNGAFGARLPG